MPDRDDNLSNHKLNALIDKIELIAYEKYNSDAYNNINSIFNMLTDMEKVLFLKYSYKIITSLILVMDMTDMQEAFMYASDNNKDRIGKLIKKKEEREDAAVNVKALNTGPIVNEDLSGFGPTMFIETPEQMDKRMSIGRKHRLMDISAVAMVVLLILIIVIAISSSSTIGIFRSTAGFFSTVFGL